MKKLLSFVLVLALVLGSFSMVFAADTAKGLSDIAGDANEEAINVVNGLGIVTGYTDGSFKSDNAVTRAEFAAMITRALNVPESALAGYTASTFLDTAGYGWAVPYLAFCNAKGIMLGDGNGNAMPGQTITVNQAVTMVVRALGITDNSSLLVGSWPSNYVTMGQKLNLYKKVDATATVDRGSAAQMIYNALTIPNFYVNADGQTKNDLPNWLNGLKAAGTSPQAVTRALTANSNVNAISSYGEWAVVYFNDDNKVVAVENKATMLTGKISKVGTFKADGVEYTITSTGTAPAIVNGLDISATTPFAFNTTSGTVTLACDITGKTITKVYAASKWTATETLKVADTEDFQDAIADDKQIVGNANYKFATDKSKEIDATQYVLTGVDSLDKIAKNDIVTIYANGTDLVKIAVSNATVSGKITGTKDVDGTTNYVINGTNYEAMSGVTMTVGDTGTAKLAANGTIFEWTVDDAAANNYAVLVATAAGTGFDSTATQVKLFTQEGQTITPLCKTGAVTTSANAIAANSIVKYALNSDGKVSKIEALNNATPTGMVINGATIGTYKIASSVVVFTNDAGSEAYTGDWAVGKIADLDADGVTVAAYVKSDGIVVLVAGSDDLGNTSATYGVINKTSSTARNAKDSDTVQLLDVLIDGVASTDVYTDSPAGTFVTTTTTTGLQKITKNSDGIVTTAAAFDKTAVTAAACTAVDGNLVTVTGGAIGTFVLADNAVVYVWNATDSKWEVKKASNLKGKTVKLYDTTKAECDNIYDVVLAW